MKKDACERYTGFTLDLHSLDGAGGYTTLAGSVQMCVFQLLSKSIPNKSNCIFKSCQSEHSAVVYCINKSVLDQHRATG